MQTVISLAVLFFFFLWLVKKWDRKRKVETMDQGDLSMGNKYELDEFERKIS